jgi:hypothetical protein
VSCNASSDPFAGERGAWGIAATASGEVDVVIITVTR